MRISETLISWLNKHIDRNKLSGCLQYLHQFDFENLGSECELEFDQKDKEWKYNEFNSLIMKVPIL